MEHAFPVQSAKMEVPATLKRNVTAHQTLKAILAMNVRRASLD